MAQSQSFSTDLPFPSFSSADAEQEHHPPVPAIVQCHVEFCAGHLKEQGRGNEEDKVHPDLFVVAPERPAVDKLLAEKVLVSNIKPAEDLNLRPFTHMAPGSKQDVCMPCLVPSWS